MDDRRDLERLERVATLLASDPELRHSAQHLAGRICAEMDLELCVILVLDAGSQLLREAGSASTSDSEALGRITGSAQVLKSGTWLERALRQEGALVANQAEADARVEPELRRQLAAHRLLTAPLRFEGEVVGAMHLVNKRSGEFTADDIRLAQLLAPQVASVVSSSRQYGQTNEALLHRLDEQSTLVETSLALTSSGDLDAVLGTLAARLTDLPQVLACRIALVEEGTSRLTVRAARERVTGDATGVGHSFDYLLSPWHRRAVEERGPVVVQRGSAGEWGQPAGATSWLLLLPLVAGGRVLGVLSISEAVGDRAEPFTPERIAFYQLMATQAALGIEKARLFSDLRSSEENFRELFENANDIIYIHDFSGRILAANHRAAEALGHPPEDLNRPDAHRMLPPALLIAAEAELTRIGRGETPIGTHEVEVHRRDGSMIPLEVSLRVINRDGRPHAVQGIARDLTERRRMEEQLLRTERLRALGELSAGVAHDFNNVLAGILGRAQILLSRVEDADLRRGLETIERSAQDGAEMIRRIQGFTRTDNERRPETVDMAGICDDALEMTRPRWRTESARRGHRVVLEKSLGPVPPVAGRASELREVMVNLINNALDAMAEGGTLRVSTNTDGQHAVVVVGDTGPGITEAVRARVFDPFFTTKGTSGTGLGLSICFQIVTGHAGTIQVDSAPGQGSTFTVRIPAGTGDVAEARLPQSPTRSDQLAILAVDDEPTMVELLERLLGDMGHTVVTAPSGVEALRAMGRQRFDMVLTDLGMPELNGWELARRVKIADPDVFIGLVTGWGGQLDEAEIVGSGIDLVLPKPFQVHELAAAVSQAIAVRAARSKPPPARTPRAAGPRRTPGRRARS